MVTELDTHFEQSSSSQTGIDALHGVELTRLFVIIIK
jgi:hypothetical protein